MIFVFFLFLCLISVIIIWKTWSRYRWYSKGYYNNGGQDIILWCKESVDNIIESLNHEKDSDTLKYCFFREGEEYYLEVCAVKRLQKESLFHEFFLLQFIPRVNGTYIVASLNKRKILRVSAFESELYEFFVKKLNCVPSEKVV